MATAYKILPHYTFEDYCRWEGQWELIEGIPYAMTPMPKPEHQWVAGNMHAEFRSALQKNNCSCKVYQPIDYKVSEDTVLNPDLLVVCKPIVKSYLDFTPDLVAEILSSSTALKDRHTKFDIYQSEKINYYLIINIEEKAVEVYKLNEGTYERQKVNQQQPFLFSFSDCSIEVLLDNIWS